MTDEEETEDGAREERSGGSGAGTRALGVERWVQFAFIALFGVGFWLFGRIVETVWDRFAEPPPVSVALAALLISVVVTFSLYKHPEANRFAHEAARELSKVTWPTRKETWSNTVVVVITSVIAACILFVFDASWSWITDLIYKG